MFKHVPLVKQIFEERRKNARLEERHQKNVADIEYIAMMCDVELEIQKDENGGVTDEVQ